MKTKPYLIHPVKRMLYIGIVLAVLSTSIGTAQGSGVATPEWFKYSFWAGFVVVLGNAVFDFVSFESDEHTENWEDYPAIYLFSKQELSDFKTLESKEARQDFVESYWERNDPYPEDQTNELHTEYLQRVELANHRYKELKKMGWQTDRGRVFLLFGLPMDTNYEFFKIYTTNSQNEYNFRNLEIWYYDKQAGPNKIPNVLNEYFQNGMMFVFAENSHYGDFEQIFSTESGEEVDAKLYRYDVPEIVERPEYTE